MDTADLLNKRVIVVLGKGGTGKSTLSAALAYLAAEQGKRVLVFQTTSKEMVSHFFGHDGVGYVEEEVYPGVMTGNLYPQQAVLEEFLTFHIRFKRIYKRLFKSPIYKYTIQGIPGLKELLTVGKVMVYESMVNEDTNKRLYDLIILDAPATGHGVSFLQVPAVAMDTIPFGPVYKNSKAVFDLLTDPKRSACCIVSLPEEMPVNESVDLQKSVVEELKLPMGPVFMNQMLSGVIDEDDVPALKDEEKRKQLVETISGITNQPDIAPAMMESMDSYVKRFEICRYYVNDIKNRMNVEPIIIPYLYRDNFQLDEIKRIAKEIKPFVTAEA